MAQRKTTSRLAAALLLSLAMGALAVPAAADDEGVVDATVTVAEAAEACILLDGTNIDFGTLDFGDLVGVNGNGPSHGLVSCSTAPQDLFVRGTDAASVEGSLWSLTDTPSGGGGLPGVNEYFVGIPFWGLFSTEDKLVGPFPAGQQSTIFYALGMPAVGSAGAGETMNFRIIWTAVVSS